MEKSESSNGSAPRIDSIDLDQAGTPNDLEHELFNMLSKPRPGLFHHCTSF
jgi:hypothetical protein